MSKRKFNDISHSAKKYLDPQEKADLIKLLQDDLDGQGWHPRETITALKETVAELERQLGTAQVANKGPLTKRELELTEVAIQAMLSRAENKARNELIQHLNEIHMPILKDLHDFEKNIFQLNAQAGTLSKLKAARQDVLKPLLDEISEDLAVRGIRFKNYATEIGMQIMLPVAGRDYIDSMIRLVSDTQDGIGLMREGKMAEAAALISKTRTEDNLAALAISSLDFGGTPRRGPGPIQALILKGVRQIWNNPQRERSFLQSVRAYHAELTDKFENHMATDDERKALDKLNASEIETYVLTLHKRYPESN